MIITLVMSFVCSYLSFCDVQMYDIYTPMGSPVVTWLMDEADTSTRRKYDNYWSASFPYAQKIITYDGLSSTNKFNCHGYAWLRVEQEIDRWIGYHAGNRDPDIYMTDGSYIEVSTETYPGKVFWNRPNGDHSAITTEQQGWFISKWNAWPLFRHRWDQSPFGTNFKYYVKNCGVGTTNFANQTVTTFKTVFGNDVNLSNITIRSNGKLVVNACNNITIENVTIQQGGTLDIRADGNVNYYDGFTIDTGANFINY